MRVAGAIQKRHFYRHVPRLKNPREVSRDCANVSTAFLGAFYRAPHIGGAAQAPVADRGKRFSRNLRYASQICARISAVARGSFLAILCRGNPDRLRPSKVDGMD
jgi:hypothetical protein